MFFISQQHKSLWKYIYIHVCWSGKGHVMELYAPLYSIKVYRQPAHYITMLCLPHNSAYTFVLHLKKTTFYFQCPN